MMTWQPKTTPRVLEAVKAVTVTAVISFFAVAATETAGAYTRPLFGST